MYKLLNALYRSVKHSDSVRQTEGAHNNDCSPFLGFFFFFCVCASQKYQVFDWKIMQTNYLCLFYAFEFHCELPAVESFK